MNNLLFKPFLVIVFALCLVTGSYGEDKEMSQEEIDFIADKIFRNECGRQEEYLVSWNYGEELASLGIGHFIWYPANQKKVFNESFTDLLKFFKADNIKLPEWLLKDSLPVCPWQSYNDFKKNEDDPKIIDLRSLLKSTISQQTLFIIRRQQQAISKIIEQIPDSMHQKITDQYTRLVKTPKGFYPLTDYVNFKGEGILESERYNGKGWGLLQVLSEMEGSETGLAAIKEFARAAAKVLNERIKNSPPERGEERWQHNWNNRVNRYVSDCSE